MAQTETESGWKVMIVDHISVRIISAACRMYDITDEGVTLVSTSPSPSTSLFRSPSPRAGGDGNEGK